VYLNFTVSSAVASAQTSNLLDAFFSVLTPVGATRFNDSQYGFFVARKNDPCENDPCSPASTWGNDIVIGDVPQYVQDSLSIAESSAAIPGVFPQGGEYAFNTGIGTYSVVSTYVSPPTLQNCDHIDGRLQGLGDGDPKINATTGSDCIWYESFTQSWSHVWVDRTVHIAAGDYVVAVYPIVHATGKASVALGSIGGREDFSTQFPLPTSSCDCVENYGDFWYDAVSQDPDKVEPCNGWDDAADRCSTKPNPSNLNPEMLPHVHGPEEAHGPEMQPHAHAPGDEHHDGCGDNVVSPGEQCDDGNTQSCDGCSSSCTFEYCGNGIQECSEACDDGNVASGDGCDHCQPEGQCVPVDQGYYAHCPPIKSFCAQTQGCTWVSGTGAPSAGPPPSGPCPQDCIIWTDGCNDCNCASPGVVGRCTQKPCPPNPPKAECSVFSGQY
jgi:cysteine-rich repeat protein